MQLDAVIRDTKVELLTAFIARFGEAALDLCAAAAARMAVDQELAARVRRRHAWLGEQYVALGAADTLATAAAAGRRALLVILLLESGTRFFAA